MLFLTLTTGLNFGEYYKTQHDLFAYKLDYETAPTPQWSGNIGRQSWNHVDNGTAVGVRNYAYTYDASDRLKTASYASQSEPAEDYSLPMINYDKNGNILSLNRRGKVSSSSYGNIDNLLYSYSGNRLLSVSDAVSGNDNKGDFRDVSGSTDYTYWENGNLKSDANKGISLIEYNTFLNKISKITYSDGRWIEFTYDGAGELAIKENSTGEIWEYGSGYIYKNDVPYQLPIPEDRAVYEDSVWKLRFEYRDVWNNLRVSFAAENGNLVKKQQGDYDAYGYSYNTQIPSSQSFYKYQNQLRVEDFGLNIDFFRFRPSDNTYGRFWQIDPLASEYPHNSTYALQENKFGLGVELEGAELKGFGEGLYESLERNVNALTVNLPETLKGFASMQTPIGKVMMGVSLQQTYEGAVTDWNSGDLDKRGNIVGNIVGEIAIGALASKGIGAIGKGAEAGSIAGKVSKLAI